MKPVVINPASGLEQRDRQQRRAILVTHRSHTREDVKIEPLSPDHAFVSFMKRWDATLRSGRPFAGSESESLTMMNIENAWEIAAKQDLKIYSVTS